MAFVKTHWVDDSEPAITAAQLNRIEDGIAEAGESSKAIVLTQAEYDALSDEEKDSDNVYYISDAPFESSNVVPLTRAEYDALSDATKMDGRFYYITDEAEVAKSLVVQTNVNSTETVPSSAVVYGLNESLTYKSGDSITYGWGIYVGIFNAGGGVFELQLFTNKAIPSSASASASGTIGALRYNGVELPASSLSFQPVECRQPNLILVRLENTSPSGCSMQVGAVQITNLTITFA